jgi:hypothetical protein
MKQFAKLWPLLLIASLFFLSGIGAQAQDRIAFGGVGYFAPAAPDFQGFLGMAVPIGADGKAFSWTDMDFSIVKTGGQFTVAGQHLAYSIKTGVAYRLYGANGWALLGLGAPGLQTDGDSVSAKVEYGIALHKWVKQDKIGLLFPFTAETHKDLNDGSTATNFAPRFALTFRF